MNGLQHLAGILVLLSFQFARAVEVPPASPARPTHQQLEFSDWEQGAFIHFSIGTFTGIEHGEGSASPSLFIPDKLNVRQWVACAKSMGAR